ncbi:MAG: hypothetical protein ACN6RD_04440 [Stenotrophomonas maltophilia]
MNTSPAGAVPLRLKPALAGTLSLVATLPPTATPTGVLRLSLTATGASNRRTAAVVQLLGNAASHS